MATACTLLAHAMGAAHRTPTGCAAPRLIGRTRAPVAIITVTVLYFYILLNYIAAGLTAKRRIYARGSFSRYCGMGTSSSLSHSSRAQTKYPADHEATASVSGLVVEVGSSRS